MKQKTEQHANILHYSPKATSITDSGYTAFLVAVDVHCLDRPLECSPESGYRSVTLCLILRNSQIPILNIHHEFLNALRNVFII